MWVKKPSGDYSTNASNAGPNSDNVLAKDYRTECTASGNTNGPGGTEITRDYPDNNTELANGHTTWATHPAFSWGTEETGYTELNGIWVGKFETTGNAINPTILPNQKHIGDMNTTELGNIGGYYTIAKHIGIYDPNNTGGNDVTVTIDNIEQTLPTNDQWPSKHNLDKATSHMLKNSEWGAVAYLASSDYGADIDSSGNSKVFNNAQYQSGTDGNGRDSYGVTGCGPNDLNGSTTPYDDGDDNAMGTNTACSTDPELGPKRSYNGEIGVLASTTNNVYGIYDMAGGAYEYVMGNLSDYANKATANWGYSPVNNGIPTPYVDIYLSTDFSSSNKPDWSASAAQIRYSNDICTWGNCGGHALHETKLYQSVSSVGQSWGGDDSLFVEYSNGRWFLRGGSAGSGSDAGLFYSSNDNGSSYYYNGFRAALFTQGALYI